MKANALWRLSLILLLSCYATISHANQPEIERQKAKIVYRMYEATDDMLIYCADVPKKQFAAHKKDVQTFWEQYPEFAKLIKNSAHYPEAVKHLTSPKANPDNFEAGIYARECDYYQRALQDMTTSEGGEKDVEEMIQILKQ